MKQHFKLPIQLRQVETLFITVSGEQFSDKETYDKYAMSFLWVDRYAIAELYRLLKPHTESWNKSQIVIKEKDQQIDLYINVPADFKP